MSVASPIEARPASSSSSSESAPVLNTTGAPDDGLQPELQPWVLFVSVLPFLVIPVAHLLSNPATATGMFHYELPYYVANGRAAIERGNGLLYPNPFDPSVAAPAIYVHWLPEMLGIATAVFGADPGIVVLCMTFAAALVFAAASKRLVEFCLPRESNRSIGVFGSSFVFLCVMWGGGVLAISSVVAGWFVRSPEIDPLAMDPGNGMWFLNWGRNALFPTEAIYHALVALCWVAELRHRRVAANVFLLLLTTTHPWSGLELLLTVNLWRGVRLLMTRQRSEAIQLALSVSMLVVFLGYYRIWLPSFEQHAELQSVWELDWSLKWSSALAAWGVVGVAAAYRLASDRSAWQTETVQFLLCALVVAAGLSLHDRVITPVQPLHFTRGYVWMPLCLLGVPALLKLTMNSWRRSRTARVAVCGMCLILVSDNLVFGVIHSWRQYQQQDGFHLDAHDRALLVDLHEKYPEAVVLTESSKINYLLPAYANLRPWLGHQFNTPAFPERREIMDRCFAGATVSVSDIPPDVTLLAVKSMRNAQPLVDDGRWLDARTRNAQWSVWIREVSGSE